MAKLEQRKGLYGGFKPGSTGGPGTGPVRKAIKNASRKIKNKTQEVASNVRKNQENKKNSRIENEIAAEGKSKNPRFLQDALNPAQNAAMTAGGSRPMTAMNNPQIDPITGMPITPGGQANMNPNFIGGMANSNLPTTGMVAQEKKYLKEARPLKPAVADRSDSTAMFMAGTAPGQFGNSSWKPAADSAKNRFPNIDPSKISESDIYKGTKFAPNIENSYGGVSEHLDVVNTRYNTNQDKVEDKVEDKMAEERRRESIINTDFGRKAEVIKGVNYTPNPNPEKNYEKGFEPFGSLSGQPKSISSRKINGNTVLGGNQPTKQSGLGAVVQFDRLSQERLTQSRRGTKCMRVKRK